MSIGAELSVAVGPVGRTGAGNVSVAAEGLAHAYSCKCYIAVLKAMLFSFFLPFRLRAGTATCGDERDTCTLS